MTPLMVIKCLFGIGYADTFKN